MSAVHRGARAAILAALLGSACYDVETPPTDVPPLPSDDDTPSADDDSTVDDDSTGTDPGDDDSKPLDDDSSPSDDDSTPDPTPDPTPEPTPEPPTPPPPPSFPATLDHLTIGVRTATPTYSDTDANTLSLCLTATRCFPMNAADVDDFRLGEMDIYHVGNVGLPRADVDRVEIRSVNGDDQWELACAELRFDGEPVHCQDGLALEFGNGSGELASWSDPAGLHNACGTCQGSLLTHGPIVGCVTHDEAVLLVRTDATRLVTAQAAPAGSPLSDAAWSWPLAGDDFFGELALTGLLPDTEYSYAVTVAGSAESWAGSFTTAPPPGTAASFRVAFGSCSRLDGQPIFDVVLDKGPDLFLFVGDNHYGNTNDLDSLRWNYRWAHSRPERRAMMQVVPTLAVWDDHDYTGNNTDGTAPGKAMALQAFEEAWANPAGGTAGADGVFATHEVGDVRFYLLDDRYWRGSQNSVLGQAQTDWLLDRVVEGSPTWHVFVLGSQWTADGSSDSWAQFLPARDDLLAELGALSIDGAVFLSGDIHRSEFRALDVADLLGYEPPELTSSPLANNNSSCPSGESELLTCYAWGSNFVTIDFGLGPSGPEIVASLFREGGGLESEWTIPRADLESP